MKKTTIISMLIFLSYCFAYDAAAQWQSDQNYGFKINIPSGWSKNAYKDGTDQVYDFYSADQNAAIQLRALKADSRLSLDMLIQVYEQNMLPAGTQKKDLTNHTSQNGIPGKQGIYSTNYNGNEVTMATFYTIQNGNAYVLTAIVPNKQLSQKQDEVKSITRSFIINGFETKKANNQPNSQDNVAPSGARPSAQTPSSSTTSHPAHVGYTASWPGLGSWQHIASKADEQVTSERLHPTTGYKREHHRISGPWELRFDYPENWSRKKDSYSTYFRSDKTYSSILVSDRTKYITDPEKAAKEAANKDENTQYLGSIVVKGITMYLVQSKQVVGMQNNIYLRNDYVYFKTPKQDVYSIRFTCYYNEFDKNVKDAGLHLLNSIAFFKLGR